MSEVLKRLSNVTIVDRGALVKLKGDELAAVMIEASNDPTKPVRVIDNIAFFFSDDALFNAIDTNSADLALIAEYRGVKFDDADRFVITKAIELRERIRQDLISLTPPPPPYPFKKLPDGWTFADNIAIKGIMVRRIKGNTSYSISLKQLEKVWNMAVRYWLKLSSTDRISIQAGGDIRRATAYRTGEDGAERVTIGCQEILRYELEQVALNQGWVFPEAKAA